MVLQYIDIGFNNVLLYKFSDDIGKSMENAVFLELCQRGLVNACKAYGLEKGLIISYEEEELFKQNEVSIEVLSLVSFLLEERILV